MIEFELPNARGVFTTRAGGVSLPPYDTLNVGRLTDDLPKQIERNFTVVRAAAGDREIQLLKQVHGGVVHRSDDETMSDMPEADACITSRRGRALLATGADCPPVALGDGVNVAIVHCGWKPLAAGIIKSVAAQLKPGFHAVIGPGICVNHYEVGTEVVEALGEAGRQSATGRQLDLENVISLQLLENGASDVQDVDRCTFCEPDAFFSHRRDGGVTGRQAGIVWLN